MSGGDRALEEKLIAELDWLVERSKRDYKGNPFPFEKRKNRQLVEEERRKVASKLAGDSDFLPFWHGQKSLAEDAVPLHHLCGVHNTNTKKISSPGSGTSASESVATCLNWAGNGNSAAQEVPAPKFRRRLQPSSPIWDSHSISCMTPAERATAYREIILKYPKLKRESLQILHNRWNRESQLKRSA